MKLELEFHNCAHCPYVKEYTETTFKEYACQHPSYDRFSMHMGGAETIPDWCPILRENKRKEASNVKENEAHWTDYYNKSLNGKERNK